MIQTVRGISFSLGLASLVLASPCGAWSVDLTGPARVIDGDTIVISGTHVRLWGIDAPEHDQTCQDKNAAIYECGKVAATYLAALISDQPVSCTPNGHDRYDRTVAVCRVANGELNSAMVSAGWAIDYVKYSHGHYLAEEQHAQQGHLGLWSGWFEIPEKWRQQHAHLVGQPTPLRWNLWSR